VNPLLEVLSSHVPLFGALLAAVDTMVIPKVHGNMPGVQIWHNHSGKPTCGESVVGHRAELISVVSAWGESYLGRV
jgi:hypothetical protein